MANVRRSLYFSAGIATLASLASAEFFLVDLLGSGFSGWGLLGGFVAVYADWEYSPQAPEVWFGVSFTLFLTFLCIFIWLSRFSSRVKALSIAGVIVLVLNSFYIWSSGILYPQTNGLQNYVTGSFFVFVQAAIGNWTDYGLKFIDFGLPILALCAGLCGMALGKNKVNRVIGFSALTSIAVFPLGLECHVMGLGSAAVTSYFGLSTSPLHLITNDLILYLSGFVLLFCSLAVLLKDVLFRSGQTRYRP